MTTETIGLVINLALLLPHYVALPPTIIFLVIFALNSFDCLTKKGFTKNRLNLKQLFVIFILLFLIYILSVLPMLYHFARSEMELNRKISDLKTVLSSCVHGIASGETPNNGNSTKPPSEMLNCEGWDLCTDFKSDLGLDNKHYTHAHEDPQILILESGSWPSPPLYFDKETSSFYSFKLDATPLDSEAGNIVIISKDMFRLFIGDGDYRSLAFEKWNHRISDWERKEESKIYLGRDLKSADIEPKTQFNITVETKKKAGKVEVTFSLTYKPSDGKEEKETVKFVREISLPAAEPEKILTKVGTGMYRSKGDIQQAKFYFMGLKEK